MEHVRVWNVIGCHTESLLPPIRTLREFQRSIYIESSLLPKEFLDNLLQSMEITLNLAFQLDGQDTLSIFSM